MTKFQAAIYKALMKVPTGRVVSYQTLANMVGVRSPQAVGQALKNNPHAPIVPCHRVIKSNGNIGGYFGANDSLQKKALLESEGVSIDQEGFLEDTDLFWKE